MAIIPTVQSSLAASINYEDVLSLLDKAFEPATRTTRPHAVKEDISRYAMIFLQIFFRPGIWAFTPQRLAHFGVPKSPKWNLVLETLRIPEGILTKKIYVNFKGGPPNSKAMMLSLVKFMLDLTCVDREPNAIQEGLIIAVCGRQWLFLQFDFAQDTRDNTKIVTRIFPLTANLSGELPQFGTTSGGSAQPGLSSIPDKFTREWDGRLDNLERFTMDFEYDRAVIGTLLNWIAESRGNCVRKWT